MMRSTEPSPAWIPLVLRGAGIYNLVWGTAAILAPRFMLAALGITTDAVGLAFWQCLGMVIGVYGIGYWIAARDPAGQWPIVLVGLLGKVLGPIGFVWTAAQGALPFRTGWTLLTNDLMWWIPFALILRHAMRGAPGCSPRAGLEVARSMP